MNGTLNFGYPWFLTYGHLIPALLVISVLLAGYLRRWPRTVLAILAALALWCCAAFWVARFVININGRAYLPTAHFMPSGMGRVLDMGAGTGRSSIMVLEARPQATLVALDLFSDSYRHHFGEEASPEQRLRNNLKSVGVEERATIKKGDMRSLPFESGVFDAVVSAYAIDHLNREGTQRALAEAARVLKPRGEMLLMLVGKDRWMQFSFGPFLLHSGMRGADWWTSRLQEAGFQVNEHGMRPATLYFLAQRSQDHL